VNGKIPKKSHNFCKIWGFHGDNYENAVFWDVAPCRYCVNLRFGGTYRLHFQGIKYSHLFTLFPRSQISYTLKMEAIRSSETSDNKISARRHIPEDGILHPTMLWKILDIPKGTSLVKTTVQLTKNIYEAVIRHRKRGKEDEGWKSTRKDWVLSLCAIAWRSSPPSPHLVWLRNEALWYIWCPDERYPK
jgi:hypothetical protein